MTIFDKRAVDVPHGAVHVDVDLLAGVVDVCRAGPPARGGRFTATDIDVVVTLDRLPEEGGCRCRVNGATAAPGQAK